jgi:hypothetical protein
MAAGVDGIMVCRRVDWMVAVAVAVAVAVGDPSDQSTHPRSQIHDAQNEGDAFVLPAASLRL